MNKIQNENSTFISEQHKNLPESRISPIDMACKYWISLLSASISPASNDHQNWFSSKPLREEDQDGFDFNTE